MKAIDDNPERYGVNTDALPHIEYEGEEDDPHPMEVILPQEVSMIQYLMADRDALFETPWIKNPDGSLRTEIETVPPEWRELANWWHTQAESGENAFGAVQPDGYRGYNEEDAKDTVKRIRQIKQFGNWKKEILPAIKYFFSKAFYQEFEAFDMRTGEMTILPGHEYTRTFSAWFGNPEAHSEFGPFDRTNVHVYVDEGNSSEKSSADTFNVGIGELNQRRLLFIGKVIMYRMIHKRIRQIILLDKRLAKDDPIVTDYLDAAYIQMYPMDETVPFIMSLFRIISMPIFGGYDHPENETGLVQSGLTRRARRDNDPWARYTGFTNTDWKAQGVNGWSTREAKIDTKKLQAAEKIRFLHFFDISCQFLQIEKNILSFYMSHVITWDTFRDTKKAFRMPCKHHRETILEKEILSKPVWPILEERGI